MANVIEKSGVHLTGADSGWPVGYDEVGPVKDGSGDDPHARAGEVHDGIFEVSERQRIGIHATSGTYKITFSGQQTAALAWNANAAAVQAALEALSNIGVGDVLVTAAATDADDHDFYLSFAGALAEADQPEVTVQNVDLAGGVGGTAVSVQTITPGS